MRVDELRGATRRDLGVRRAKVGRRCGSCASAIPTCAITVLDDAEDAATSAGPTDQWARHAIAAAIGDFDVVVKSPGISLYDPLVRAGAGNGVRFTSLLNLWFADAPTSRRSASPAPRARARRRR